MSKTNNVAPFEASELVEFLTLQADPGRTVTPWAAERLLAAAEFIRSVAAKTPTARPGAMTRRERHLRIIEWMSDRSINYALMQMLSGKDRFSRFTDKGIEELAKKLVDDWRRVQKMNAENRRVAAARAKGEAA